MGELVLVNCPAEDDATLINWFALLSIFFPLTVVLLGEGAGEGEGLVDWGVVGG